MKNQFFQFAVSRKTHLGGLLVVLLLAIVLVSSNAVSQAKPMAPPNDGDQICVSNTTQLDVTTNDPVAGTYTYTTVIIDMHKC